MNFHHWCETTGCWIVYETSHVRLILLKQKPIENSLMGLLWSITTVEFFLCTDKWTVIKETNQHTYATTTTTSIPTKTIKKQKHILVCISWNLQHYFKQRHLNLKGNIFCRLYDVLLAFNWISISTKIITETAKEVPTVQSVIGLGEEGVGTAEGLGW